MITQNIPQYFSPESLNMLQDVYDEFTELSGFSIDPSDLQQFATALIFAYEQGATEGHSVRKVASEFAEKRNGMRAARKVRPLAAPVVSLNWI